MIRHIRPYQLFSGLNDRDRDVMYHIPKLPGSESLTVFSLETLCLVSLARMIQAKTILEIGTSWGYNALHLAENTYAHVTTVDIEEKPRYVWEDKICAFKIENKICDSRELEDAIFDMIFVDGDHSYETVKLDSEYALRNARRLVVWHDYNDQHPGVKQYLEELSETRDMIHVEDTWLALYFPEGR